MDGKLCILAVDDEEINLGIMEEYLERANYLPLVAKSGEEALEVFHNNADKIDIILLDRMMPGMDGIDVLRKIKGGHTHKHIPIIMQTAAATSDEVVEGIEAGAFYYLTKPYDRQTLLAIVNSAAQSVRQFRQFTQESYRNILIDSSVSSHFRLHTIDQAKKLATFLGQMCPYCPISSMKDYEFSGKLSYGFYELMVNSIEHGNLSIGYDEKTLLLDVGEERWLAEIEKRQERPENLQKFVDVHYMRMKDSIRVVIKDQGRGFDWKPFMEIDPMRIADNHGRGIAIANVIFDRMEYTDNGSQVACTLYLDKLPLQLPDNLKLAM